MNYEYFCGNNIFISMRFFPKELKAQIKVKPGGGPPHPAAAYHRFKAKAQAVKKSVVAFGGPIKPHQPNKPVGAIGAKQPKEDRRPNSMSTIERKRGVEGHGVKLPKLGIKNGNAEKLRRDSGGPVNNKPFVDHQPAGGGGGGLIGLLARKGGPIKVAYEADDGVEQAGPRRLHSPVNVNPGRNGSIELRGESEYIALGDDQEAIAGAHLDKLLQQAKNARAAPSEVSHARLAAKKLGSKASKR